jgi:Domain of unknown function (DUF4345)
LNFPRGVLLVTSGIFAVVGVWGFVSPASLLSLVDVEVPTATASADARAQYGGFTLGMGVFLVLCAVRKEWTAAGLAAGAITLTGFALARAVSAVVEGPVRPIIFVLMVSEACGAVCGRLADEREVRSHRTPGLLSSMQHAPRRLAPAVAPPWCWPDLFGTANRPRRNTAVSASYARRPGVTPSVYLRLRGAPSYAKIESHTEPPGLLSSCRPGPRGAATCG